MAAPLSNCIVVEELVFTEGHNVTCQKTQQPLCENLNSVIVSLYGFADTEKSSLLDDEITAFRMLGLFTDGHSGQFQETCVFSNADLRNSNPALVTVNMCTKETVH
jgi:hypothetical protein